MPPEQFRRLGRVVMYSIAVFCRREMYSRIGRSKVGRLVLGRPRSVPGTVVDGRQFLPTTTFLLRGHVITNGVILLGGVLLIIRCVTDHFKITRSKKNHPFFSPMYRIKWNTVSTNLDSILAMNQTIFLA